MPSMSGLLENGMLIAAFVNERCGLRLFTDFFDEVFR